MKRTRMTIGWFTAFLCVALLWGSPAMAKNYGLYIAGRQVTDANCNNLKDIKGVTVTADGEFKYDPATKTLTMKDVTVSVGGDKNAIWNKSIEGLTIEVSGSNRLEATNWSSLNCFASTKIEGSGSLTTTSKENSGVYINSNTTLTISNITLEATGKWGIAGLNVNQNETLIKNATVNAKGTEAAIDYLKTLTLEGCHIAIPDGGKFDKKRFAVVDAQGSRAKEVKIVPGELYGLSIAGVQVSEFYYNDLSKITGVEVKKGGDFKYDLDTKTLTMKDVTVSVGDNKNAIEIKGIEGLEIKISGTNQLKSTNYSSLYCYYKYKRRGDSYYSKYGKCRSACK